MNLQVFLFPGAREYISSLPEKEHGRISSDINAMKEGRFDEVRTKQLRGSIHELIRGRHRITYFKIDSTLYFVRGFAKKTAKTPRAEIEYAEQKINELKSYEKAYE